MPDTNDLDRFPKRKSPRLQGYDYSQQNYYFVTICTHRKRCLFGSPQQLSPLGKMTNQALALIPEHFPDVAIDKYVVMPNHVHVIIATHKEGVSLSTIVGQFKAAVTKRAHLRFPELMVWQTSFHDHVIRNQADYLRIWEYIDTNPLKWQEDCFYCSNTE